MVSEKVERVPHFEEAMMGWKQCSRSELVDWIEVHYHKPLKKLLPVLKNIAARVAKTHGDQSPYLFDVRDLTFKMHDELMDHMIKEERVLFPWLRTGEDQRAGASIRRMMLEHEGTVRQLDQMAEWTHFFELPEGAGKMWGALWRGLLELDESLRQHIYLEEEVLFKAGGE